MNKLATHAQIAELDRLAMVEFGLDILQMMEIAGNKFALIVSEYLKNLDGKRILVLSGVGNNGGDGICAARYLANWGASVEVILAKDELREAPAHHRRILEIMEIKISVGPTEFPKADLIIDSLLGYNLKGNAKSPYDLLIEAANGTKTPVIAFDNPSGLDIETGKPTKQTIKALMTVTLAVIKQGLAQKSAREYVGDIKLVDLGIPKKAYEKSGLEYPF